MKIIVASRNPVKIAAVEAAFDQAFAGQSVDCEGIGVDSGVSDQPMTDEETLLGAKNRARAAERAWPQADYWVGLEGGLAPHGESLEAFAWMVIRGQGREGRGRTAGFLLPPAVTALIHDGLELGEADDRIFGTENSKQSNGAVGLLTDNLITRTMLYQPALLLALIPFLRPDLYPAAAGETPATE